MPAVAAPRAAAGSAPILLVMASRLTSILAVNRQGAPEGENPPVILIEKLTREFAGVEVLGGLNLTVAEGERLAVRGPNGSGKTTLLRCLLGTVAPTSGRVAIGGHDAGTLVARRLVGASLGQERSFYLRLSGADNLRFFGRLRGIVESKVDAVIAELDLQVVVRKRVDQCSTGQLQQLAFARALLGDPRVLLLDEPTRSLDTAARERFWAALDRRRGCTAAVIATHVEDDLLKTDRAVELGLG